MSRSLSTLAVLLTVAVGHAQIPAEKQKAPLLLTGATVHPVSSAPVEKAQILIVDGKIAQIATNIPQVPPGTVRVDFAGKHVYPGLIDANSALGLVEIGAVAATLDTTERGDVTPEVRAEVAVNPDSDLLPVARAGGVLLAHTAPSGGLIAGRSAVIRLDGWTWEDLTMSGSVGLHVNWPSSRGRSRWFRRRSAQASGDADERKARQIAKLREVFAEARAYQAGGRVGAAPRDSDLRLEAMAPFASGQRQVFVHADDVRAMREAIDWAADEGVKIVIVGGQDAWRIAGELAERKIPVILSGIHRLPRRRFEAYDAPFTVAKALADAGVPFCIAGPGGSSGASNARNLPYHAATAAAYGLPKDEALKAVTLYPAQILGIGDRVGSLEVGKDATMIVTTGDPLEIRSRVDAAYIEGRRLDLDSKHKRLFRKYAEKYRRLGLRKQK